ncbi:MAG: glycerophosphodiester phosphodiesterase [Acidimicrobiia bacterium]
MSPIGFAHRGARKELPENTLPSFRRALDLGATGLESDAWCSGDGEVVLVHDSVVRRGLRRVVVRDSSAAELAAFGVPRLADLYGELGTAYALSLDVKHDGAADAVVATARRAGDSAVGGLWLCSPSLDLLTRLRAEEPDVHLVHSVRKHALSAPIERHASDLASLGVDAMNMHHSEWSTGLVALFHKFGVRSFAWDAQEVRHLRAVLAMGVDALYCDRPDRMMAVIGEFASPGS